MQLFLIYIIVVAFVRYAAAYGAALDEIEEWRETRPEKYWDPQYPWKRRYFTAGDIGPVFEKYRKIARRDVTIAILSVSGFLLMKLTIAW